MNIFKSIVIFTILFLDCTNLYAIQNIESVLNDGKRIYQQGILPNGKPLVAIGAGNNKLSGSDISCIRCHRRSGFGSTEGNLRISPILGDILYKERNKSYQQWQRKRTKGRGARPAYTDKTLKNVITIGTGADNRKLNQLMPRYNLTESEVFAVVEYLKSLTLKSKPGITKDNIHIATIITSDVPKKSSKAIIDLFKKYIKDVNAKTRKENRRASNSPWHKKWEYESFRTIQFHPWLLTGKPSSWNSQLQNYYNKQNVFVVINGSSTKPWDVIHQFCNKTKLPCLFPTLELPNLEQNNPYNFYFTGGISFDAKAISSHIKTYVKKSNKNKIVLQLYHNDDITRKASNVLKNNLVKNKIKIINYELKGVSSLSENQLSKIINQYKPNIIVSWLDAANIKALQSNSIENKNIERFYYSYSHLGEQYSNLITKNRKKSYLVYRYMLPKQKALHMRRATGWARRKKIDISQEKIIGNAFFAVTLFNRSIKKMRAYLNQDYLIEIIESALENTAFHSVYPELKLGPDQRIASKGAYILGPLDKPDVNKKENHVWIRH